MLSHRTSEPRLLYNATPHPVPDLHATSPHPVPGLHVTSQSLPSPHLLSGSHWPQTPSCRSQAFWCCVCKTPTLSYELWEKWTKTDPGVLLLEFLLCHLSWSVRAAVTNHHKPSESQQPAFTSPSSSRLKVRGGWGGGDIWESTIPGLQEFLSPPIMDS